MANIGARTHTETKSVRRSLHRFCTTRNYHPHESELAFPRNHSRFPRSHAQLLVIHHRQLAWSFCPCLPHAPS
jgi:hypothetical protein